MDATTRKWFKGCGIGCGAALVLSILLVVGGSLTIMGPFRDAIAVRESLDEQFGDQDGYTPPVDGTVAPDRLEAFLTVRTAVMALCSEFEATAAQFERMDDLDEDAPKRETFREGLSLTREVFGMVPRLGRLYAARNETLADVGMGLGEYTYIFVMAYHERLQADTDQAGALFGEVAVNRRVRGILREMLARQLAALDEDAAARNDHDDLRRRLAAEIALLDDDPERLAWQDGLPPALAESLAPYRAPLAAGFCTEMASVELNTNRQRGLSIQGS